jgi:hypothetical protein
MSPYEDFVDGSWSPVLRLGTEASNSYMKTIKEKLKTAAINEQI